MMMFGFLFCLVKIFLFFIGKLLVYLYQLLPEAKADIKQVLWSELDSNLLGEIIGRLTSPTDQARFRAVCKAWLAVHPVGNITKAAPALLPWFVEFNRLVPSMTDRLDLLLYEPSATDKPTSIHTISLTKLGIPSPLSWKDIGVRCINNWLFFSTRQLEITSSRYRRNFVLYSPYTKKIIKLPESDYPLPCTFSSAFSTDPNSPDCVFLLSDTRCLNSSIITIMTYRNGDTEWTARQFDRGDEFVPRRCLPIHFKGIFYLVTYLGQIASYNIIKGEFRFENLVIDDHYVQNQGSFPKHEVFELNGDLMHIYFGSSLDERNNDNFPAGNPYIKRFDLSSKAWIPVSSLGGQSLFIGEKIVAVATVEARHNEVMPGKIYYFSASGCMVYSLEDGGLVKHKFFISNFTYPNTTNYHLANDDHRYLSLDRLFGCEYHPMITVLLWLKPPIVIYENKTAEI